MERIVRFRPAFDKRDPDPSKDYGINGVGVVFVLKGAKGATHFVLATNWHLPHVQRDLEQKHSDHFFCHPQPVEVGYHSPVPTYEGQHPSQNECEWLDGKPCYCDSSCSAADEVYARLLREGEAGVWAALEQWYKERLDFDSGSG